jgi:adenosylcobinamide kinase/adenosylcobinamide-phosphate guanylyltransferase
MNRKLTLILGGARSGKSSYAEKLAREVSGAVLYVATAEALDEEMEDRIATHRDKRPAQWRTLEAPRDVARAIAADPGPADVLLLDCMTLLVNNLLGPEVEGNTEAQALSEARMMEEIEALLAIYDSGDSHWIVVSNEVGLGLVPPYPLGRAYRDALGRANQRLAEAADEVLFMVAGLPMQLKDSGHHQDFFNDF